MVSCSPFILTVKFFISNKDSLNNEPGATSFTITEGSYGRRLTNSSSPLDRYDLLDKLIDEKEEGIEIEPDAIEDRLTHEEEKRKSQIEELDLSDEEKAILVSKSFISHSLGQYEDAKKLKLTDEYIYNNKNL